VQISESYKLIEIVFFIINEEVCHDYCVHSARATNEILVIRINRPVRKLKFGLVDFLPYH